MSKNNLESLQEFQRKKVQEIVMMEEERKKAQEKREKLRQIVRTLIHLVLIHSSYRSSKEQKNIEK
jgi:hypothetical protein